MHPHTLSNTQRATLLASAIASILFIQGCSTVSPEKNSKTSTFDDKPATTLITQKPVDFSKPASDVKVTTDKITKQEIIKEHYDTVWPEVRNTFALAEANMGKYDQHIEFYQKRSQHFEVSLKRAEPYLYYIKTQIAERNMPMELTLLPLVESGFAPKARSNKKAVGLWQFIPSTGKTYGLHQNWWMDARSDIVLSTRAALDFLEDLHKQNNGDWLLALASYNAGYGSVLRAKKRYLKKYPHTSEETVLDFWQLRPFLPKETQNYVPKLLASAHLVKYSDQYDLDLHPVDNQPHFEVVEVNKQVSLPAIASALALDLNQLMQLNPGYLRSATPPEHSSYLLLPESHSEKFQSILASDPKQFVVNWKKHKVKSGDVLGTIAKKYKTNVSAIKLLNKLKNNRIRINQTLLIPVADDTPSQLAETTVLAKSNASGQPRAKSQAKQQATLAGKNHKTQEALGFSSNENTQDLALTEYRVQNGDNLSLIAKGYGVKTVQLKQWNNLNSNTIKPGQTLIIWQGPKTSRHIDYFVKNGDNLWLIAKNNQLSTKDLADYNDMSMNAPLRPGQRLKIPFKNS